MPWAGFCLLKTSEAVPANFAVFHPPSCVKCKHFVSMTCRPSLPREQGDRKRARTCSEHLQRKILVALLCEPHANGWDMGLSPTVSKNMRCLLILYRYYRFLKLHCVKLVNAALVGADEKAFCKWCWVIVKLSYALASLSPFSNVPVSVVQAWDCHTH